MEIDKHCNIDCSIRAVTVILEYFEHILTVYDITIHCFRRGSDPAFFTVGGALAPHTLIIYY